MKSLINQTVFNNLMKKLDIQPAETETQRFDSWMRDTVKSVHYADNAKMCNAYQRISNDFILNIEVNLD